MSSGETEKKLQQINELLLDGIIEDLEAPSQANPENPEGLEAARQRARQARVNAEAALRRHNFTGVLDSERGRRLEAVVASKLDFSSVPKRPELPPAGKPLDLTGLRLSAAPPAPAPETPDSGGERL